METSQLFYLPLGPAFFLILVLFFSFLVIYVEVRAVRYAYMQLGVSSRTALFLLFASLLGSYINSLALLLALGVAFVAAVYPKNLS
jgi:uncharacterized membrane protein